MKKLFIFSLPALIFVLVFWGCEKDFDTVLDTTNPSLQVLSVTPKDSIRFNLTDSSTTVSVEFTSSSRVNDAYFEVFDPDGKKVNNTLLPLFDNGNADNGDQTANDKIFSNKFLFSQAYPNGNYDFKFYANDGTGNLEQVAWSSIKYNNGQNNVAPVISNVIIEPDTVVANDTIAILTRLEVFDQNGLNDLQSVYFIVYRPDGTTSGNRTSLFDDGNLATNGDETAGDGIFSRIISVNQSNQKGTYRFEFQALDRGGLTSNIINYLVLIQ